MINNLPNELIVELLWDAHPLSILVLRQVCKRFKAIIDSSTKLQFLIELYRDDLDPAPRMFPKTLWTDERAEAQTLRLHDLLQFQLRSRKRWAEFNPRPVTLSSEHYSDSSIYELNNGYLAYCYESAGTDKIVFVDLNDSDGSGENKTLQLSSICIQFTFDLSQDLLITLHSYHGAVPFYILSASTGQPHTQATLPVLDDPLFIRQSHNFDGSSVNVMINGSLVCATNGYVDVDHLRVIVFDWKTGDTIFNQAVTNGGDVFLLSTTVLAILIDGLRTIETELWLVDLSHKNGACTFPITILSFPQFTPPTCDRSDTVFISAFFSSGSRSVGPEIHQTNQRVGETDVVSVFLLTETTRTTTGHSDEILDGKLVLFISKSHLLQLAVTSFAAYSHTEGDRGYNLTTAGLFMESSAIKLPYRLWGKTGTRWMNSNKFATFTEPSSYGSQFICRSNPKYFGLPSSQQQIQTYTKTQNHNNLQDAESLDSVEPTVLCLLEFNQRLWGVGTVDPSVIRDREEVDELLAMLDADVVGGMPFRVRTYKNPGADRWYNVIINRSHMLATLSGKMKVYAI